MSENDEEMGMRAEGEKSLSVFRLFDLEMKGIAVGRKDKDMG